MSDLRQVQNFAVVIVPRGEPKPVTRPPNLPPHGLFRTFASALYGIRKVSQDQFGMVLTHNFDQ